MSKNVNEQHFKTGRCMIQVQWSPVGSDAHELLCNI